MARFDAEGDRVPTDLFEAAAWRRSVVVTCRRCRKETVFDPHCLWWLFNRRGWSLDLASAARRMKCIACRAGGYITLVRHREPTRVLPYPDEREWKRAVSRFRS